MSKPTVSYVRGLRDVLELDIAQRRAYIFSKKKKNTGKLALGSIYFTSLALTGLFSEKITPFLDELGANKYSIIAVPSIALFSGFLGGYLFSRNNKLRSKEIELSRAGRLYQQSFIDGTHIPQELEREAFN